MRSNSRSRPRYELTDGWRLSAAHPSFKSPNVAAGKQSLAARSGPSEGETL